MRALLGPSSLSRPLGSSGCPRPSPRGTAGGPLRWLAGSGVVLGLVLGPGCGAMRQNLRNQFVSYRGAWSCASPGCKSSEVVQSKSGQTKGELRINHVALAPHAGLVFYPGTPVATMTATVRDCKGQSKDVPSDKVQPPGRHKIKAEPDSWVIWLDTALVSDLEVSRGDCAVLTVKTHSTWQDGSVYDAEGAIEVGG
jgi:hypothetical protein